jgi:ubiquinone/menaquinone biosynthesis C-methylase UbiE
MIPFDNEAKEYDNWYSTKLGNLADKVESELVLNLLQPYKGMKILDAGCGTGHYSIKLAERGCDVTGIDISSNMLNIARKKSGDLNLPVTFINASAAALPFENNLFDAVISVVAVEFMDDIEKSIEEMLRVTKPGGRIVIGTINKNSAWGKLYQSDYFRENTVFKHARFLDKETLGGYRNNELAEINECLFFSPDTEENLLNPELEKKLSSKNNGGFICALWKKQ